MSTTLSIKKSLVLSIFLGAGYPTLSLADPSISYLIATLGLTRKDIQDRGKKEISSFVASQAWKGGYFEGDPTIRSCIGTYGRLYPYKEGMSGAIYICYSECLVPYINEFQTVLEIGPGRGAWTKAILTLNPKNIVCVDAVSAEQSNFWEYVGQSEKVTYHQIKDFSLDCVEDDSIDFVFSFGVFCHISPLPIYEYFTNIYKKLRKGGQGFIMYADYDKKNLFAKRYNDYAQYAEKDNDFIVWNVPIDPYHCWYHMGIQRMKNMLEGLGYEVVNADVVVNERDPVIHFRKN